MAKLQEISKYVESQMKIYGWIHDREKQKYGRDFYVDTNLEWVFFLHKVDEIIAISPNHMFVVWMD